MHHIENVNIIHIYICCLNFFLVYSVLEIGPIQLLMMTIFPVFASFFLYSRNWYNRLCRSLVDTTSVPHKFLSKTDYALKFQKPLAGEKPSFISNAFRILQNNWLPWKLLVKCRNMDISMIAIAYCEVPNSCAVRNNSVGWQIHPN